MWRAPRPDRAPLSPPRHPLFWERWRWGGAERAGRGGHRDGGRTSGRLRRSGESGLLRCGGAGHSFWRRRPRACFINEGGCGSGDSHRTSMACVHATCGSLLRDAPGGHEMVTNAWNNSGERGCSVRNGMGSCAHAVDGGGDHGHERLALITAMGGDSDGQGCG